jgi:hypothetical protein
VVDDDPLVLVRRAPDWEWLPEPASTAYTSTSTPSWTLAEETDPAARWKVLKPDFVAEAEKAIATCAGHLWELTLEDCGVVDLGCERCPASVDDLYPDGQEMIYFGSDDGRIRIDAGVHDLADDDTPVTIPVTAHVLTERNYWGEYSVELIIEPRGDDEAPDPVGNGS